MLEECATIDGEPSRFWALANLDIHEEDFVVDSVPKISAEKFYKKLIPALRTVIRTPAGKIVRGYSSNPKWTSVMKKTLTNVCANEFGLNVAAEYFARFDLVAFDTITNDDWEPWALEIAFEYENDSETWEKECHKLLLLNCGLKVLISYYDGEGSEVRKRLQRFLKIYESRKYCRSNEQWLFLFLPWDQLIEETTETLAFALRNEQKGEKLKAELVPLERATL